jgi:hypothetical protein
VEGVEALHPGVDVTDSEQPMALPLPVQTPEHLPAEPLVETAVETDDETLAFSQPSPAPKRAAKTVKKTRPRATENVTPKTVRLILDKAEQLAAASPEDMELLSSALGLRGDVETLIAHIVSNTRLSFGGVDELRAIAEAAKTDAFAAMTLAIQFEAQTKSMWSILSALGLVQGNRPSNDSKASIEIARACAGFTAEHDERLHALHALTGGN